MATQYPIGSDAWWQNVIFREGGGQATDIDAAQFKSQLSEAGIDIQQLFADQQAQFEATRGTGIGQGDIAYAEAPSGATFRMGDRDYLVENAPIWTEAPGGERFISGYEPTIREAGGSVLDNLISAATHPFMKGSDIQGVKDAGEHYIKAATFKENPLEQYFEANRDFTRAHPGVKETVPVMDKVGIDPSQSGLYGSVLGYLFGPWAGTIGGAASGWGMHSMYDESRGNTYKDALKDTVKGAVAGYAAGEASDGGYLNQGSEFVGPPAPEGSTSVDRDWETN